MNVGRCMTKNPVTITPDISVPEAQALMRKENIHRLPVVDRDGNLLGIVTSSDLIHACPSDATSLDVWELHYLISKLKVDGIMKKKVISATEDETIEEAARRMVDNNISGLPVVHGKRLVGIITESDVFKLFLELFGSRHVGLRVTCLMPDRRGELASVTGAIAKAGGNIISLATFDGENAADSYCTMKVDGVDKAALRAALEPLVEKVVDIR